jgi:hypothetical protein
MAAAAICSPEARPRFLDGGADNDQIHGGDGDDVLSGGDGGDFMMGDRGNDGLSGDAGNDELFGGDDDDILDGGDGDDSLVGETGNDTLDGGNGGDDLYAGEGDDIGIFSGAQDLSTTNLFDGGSGVDLLRLELTPAQSSDPAIDHEIHDFANLISVNANPVTDTGSLFTFNTLGLSIRNVELLEVNGVSVIGDTPSVYVDPDAPDGGNGSLLSPFNTWVGMDWQPGIHYLQKAGTVAAPGVPIIVSAAGTEQDPVYLGSYGGTGDPAERPEIRAPVVFRGASHSTFDGFVVSNDSDPAITIESASHHVAITNCEIKNSSLGVWITNGAGIANRVAGNVIHNHQSHGIAITLAGGAPGEETVIANNSILSNGSHGIELHANYVIVEENEIAFSGAVQIGTSGIHVFAQTATEDAGDHNIIRFNVIHDTFQSSARTATASSWTTTRTSTTCTETSPSRTAVRASTHSAPPTSVCSTTSLSPTCARPPTSTSPARPRSSWAPSRSSRRIRWRTTSSRTTSSSPRVRGAARKPEHRGDLVDAPPSSTTASSREPLPQPATGISTSGLRSALVWGGVEDEANIDA